MKGRSKTQILYEIISFLSFLCLFLYQNSLSDNILNLVSSVNFYKSIAKAKPLLLPSKPLKFLTHLPSIFASSSLLSLITPEFS